MNNNIHTIVYNFDPKQLVLARELRGLQKKELADKLNITPSAITQFELGYTKPTPETLMRVGLALSFPVDFFHKKNASTSNISIDSCFFRSLKSTTQQERKRVLASGILISRLMTSLESQIDFPQERVSELATHVKTKNDIEALATAVRKAWLGPKGEQFIFGPISHMANLLEVHGVVVVLIPGHSERLDAFSTWYLTRPFIFLSSTKTSSSRLRFDMAHELGHLLMHADANPGDPMSEKEANAFASAFLLPRESFYFECPKRMNYGDWGYLYELKKKWKVSIAALVVRAYELGCISEVTYRRAFVHLNKSGMRLKEEYEPPMEEGNLLKDALGKCSIGIEEISHQLGIYSRDLRELVEGKSVSNINGIKEYG